MSDDQTAGKTPGERIKKLREKEGLTQAELAEKMAFSREHIAKIENGTRKIQADDVPRFASILNSSCDYVLCGKDSANLRVSRELGLDNNVIEKLAGLAVLAHMYDHDLPSGDDGIMKSVLSRKAKERLKAVNFCLSADHDFELAKAIYAFSRMDFSYGTQSIYRKDENGNVVLNKTRTDEHITELMFFDPDGDSSGISIPVSMLKNAIMEEIRRKIEKL